MIQSNWPVCCSLLLSTWAAKDTYRRDTPASFQSQAMLSHVNCFIIPYTRVLDNLKDYLVKALVNTVDHLGTVAYKLNDLLGQQTTEISATELRVALVA